MSKPGHLVGTTSEEFGATLTADVAIGDTVLHVDDTGDFDEQEGGFLLLGDSKLAYLPWDDPDDPDTDPDAGDNDGPLELTLAAASPVAADEGDRVLVFDPSTGEDDAVTDLIALVTIDDRSPGSALKARIRAGLEDQLDSDFDTYIGKAVELEIDSGELVLVGISGSKRTGKVRWWQDTATATGNTDTLIRLTYRPEPDSSVTVSWGGVRLHRSEWDFADGDPWTIIVPAQGFHADDEFEAHYAYTDPTLRPTIPATLTLVGYTAVTSTPSGTIALPAGTTAGHLLVLTACNYSGSYVAPTTSDPRVTVQNSDVNTTSIGGAANGSGVLIARGIADGSGTALDLHLTGDACAILAAFAITGDLDSTWIPLRGTDADGFAYSVPLSAGAEMGIAALAGACGTVAAGFTDDTSGNWTRVAAASGGSIGTARTYIAYTSGPHDAVFHGLSHPGVWSGSAIGIKEG